MKDYVSHHIPRYNKPYYNDKNNGGYHSLKKTNTKKSDPNSRYNKNTTRQHADKNGAAYLRKWSHRKSGARKNGHGVAHRKRSYYQQG